MGSSATRAASLVVLLSACSGPEYDLVVRFDPASTAAAAERIEVAVVPSCPADPRADPVGAIRTIELTRDASGTSFGGVPPGAYGIVGRAFGSDCAIIAAGCLEVTLTGGGSGAIELVLDAMTGAGCGPREACVGGTCVSTVDGGQRDSGVPDGAPGIDGGDAADAGTDGGIDGGIVRRDGGRTDGGMLPDAGMDGGPATCDDLFGTAPMYELCAERPGECEFYTRSFVSCEMVCEFLGSTCIEANNEDEMATVCTPMTPIPCTMAHNDLICTCAR